MELVRRVSRAWLEFVEQWIGLRRSLGTGMGDWEQRKGFFVRVELDTEVDERGVHSEEVRYVFERSNVPTFMTPEDADTVFECGKSLRYLHKFHPEHPLSKPGTSGVEPPILDWKFSWEALEG